MFDRLLQILTSDWLIHQDTILSYIPAFVSILNGNKVVFESSDEARKPKIAKFLGEEISIVPWDINNPNIPDNSLAIIPIIGPMPSWYTQEMIGYIKDAEANPSIISMLFPVSTPGGMVTQTDIAANLIKASTKPTVAVISQMAASAGMWLLSAMTYRIATSPLDQIGSIGTKACYMDFSGLLQDKLGIKSHEIYATLSTMKDNEVRQLAQDNETPMREMVDFVNTIFHTAIRDNLGLKQESEVFNGGIYFAQKAIELGLINEINTMEYAVNYAYQQGLKNKINQFSNQIK